MKNLCAIFLIVTAGCASHVRSLPPSAAQPGPAPLSIRVDGEVWRPGRFPWTNGLTAAGGIQMAGGFTDFVSIRRIEIQHWDGSRESYRLTRDLRLKQDVVLKPGDHIINFKW